MDATVFRKTAAGHAEVRERRLGLDARSRGLLILVNGGLSVAELARRVPFDPARLLVQFVEDGLIEPVAAAVKAKPVPRPAAAVVQAGPLPPPAPPPPAPAFLPADLAAAKRRALAQLAPHYGPDALQVAQSLLGAISPEAFANALQALQDKLSVAMGRKLAAEVSRTIAHGG